MDDDKAQPGPSGYKPKKVTPKKRSSRERNREKEISWGLSPLWSSDDESNEDEDDLKLGASAIDLSNKAECPQKKRKTSESENTKGTSLHEDRFIGQDNESKAITWYPKDPYSIVFDPEVYADFVTLANTVHLDVFHRRALDHEFSYTPLYPHTFVPLYLKTRNHHSSINGALFRTYQREKGHCKFGNISYVLEFMTFLNFCLTKMVFRFYFADIVQSETECTSRFFITDIPDLVVPCYYTRFDCQQFGGPWYACPSNTGRFRHRYPQSIRGYQCGNMLPYHHEVEFYVKFTEETRKELHELVYFVPEEHRDANKGGNCVRYRSGAEDNWTICPYAISRSESRGETKVVWQRRNFTSYIIFRILSEATDNMSKWNWTEEMTSYLCHEIAFPICRIMMKKTRDKCYSVIGEKVKASMKKEVDPCEINPIPLECHLSEYSIERELIQEKIKQHIAKIERYGFDETNLYFRTISRKLEMHLKELINTLAQRLYSLTCHNLTSMAMDMKAVVKNELTVP